jgi:hypothetical protein
MEFHANAVRTQSRTLAKDVVRRMLPAALTTD